MSLMLAVLAVIGSFDSTRVAGTAVALASGKPLAGVRIVLGDASTTTDSAGRFALRVPAGARPVFDFAWGGRVGVARAEGLDADPYEVVIDTEAENLKPSVMVDDWHLPGVWGMSGFFARRAKGYGHFYTRDDFQQLGYSNLRQLLGAEGVTHSCVREDGCGPVRFIYGRAHFQNVWIDGVIQTGENADSVSLADVAGVEYYPVPGPPYPTWANTHWIHDTRYFLGEPYRGSMVIVWTRGFEAPARR